MDPEPPDSPAPPGSPSPSAPPVPSAPPDPQPRWHPWRVLREKFPDAEVRHTDVLPATVLGVTDGDDVWLARDMLQVERRCTLTHEIVHLERGHRGCQPPAVEADVERESARRLVPLRALGEALAWAHDEAEAADELWVDVATLRARLDGLAPEEIAYLRARLEDT